MADDTGASSDSTGGDTGGMSMTTADSTTNSTANGTTTTSSTTSSTTSMSTGVDSSESTDAAGACEPGETTCDGDDLVQCSDARTEVRTTCDLGCDDAELRCHDIDPSNGLAEFLDDAQDEDALDFGASAQIDTDDGIVTVDGTEVAVKTELLEGTPQVRVLVVGSLLTQDVTVKGTPALAIVSDGEIKITGHFSLSAVSNTPGPGAVSDPTCRGGDQVVTGTGGNLAAGGAGGGGFGTSGAKGGNASSQGHHAAGGAAGGTIGNTTLIPLRGGCESGLVGASVRGAGGGAVQLVSREAIVVEGVISANGTSRSGGGSGGGILLEAPVVTVSGNVVANGGAGAGGGLIPQAGEHGRLDAQPAQGGPSNDVNLGKGGDGAAANVAATAGENANYVSGLSTDHNYAGHGGGGVGRIRVNTVGDGLTTSGLFSPNPTTGDLGIR